MPLLLPQGIALSADPNYKVLGSTYPWIARRLLSDSSAELQETLRALLYKGSRFQFGRLESLLRQAVRSPPRSTVASGARPGAEVSPGAAHHVTTLCRLFGALITQILQSEASHSIAMAGISSPAVGPAMMLD